jgi:phosphohistidine phosphatase SixA
MATILAILLAARAAEAQTLHGEALVKALRQGGHVIVMRHASAPREAPSRQTANADNVNLERQLDERGRSTAAAMGEALRDLKIPIGEVSSSPTYRALETVRYAQFPKPRTYEELGDRGPGGQSMKDATEAQVAWLRKKVAQLPAGSNSIIVTHLQHISGAFPQWTAGFVEGEALVFGPDGKGGSVLVSRLKIEEWPALRP